MPNRFLTIAEVEALSREFYEGYRRLAEAVALGTIPVKPDAFEGEGDDEDEE